MVDDMDPRHNYVKIIEDMMERDELPEDVTLGRLDIYHDDDCCLFAGGLCDCGCVVEYNPFLAEPGDNAVSWEEVVECFNE